MQNNTNNSNFAVIEVKGCKMNHLVKAGLFLFLMMAFLLSVNAEKLPGGEQHQLRTVVIDPGHGGKDPGTVVDGVKEKDIVLAVALRLGDKIKKQYPDLNIVFTRSKDVFIPLYARADIAIQNKADLFISLHANYAGVNSVRGSETYTLGLHRSQENLEVAKKENAVILLEEDYSTNYEGFNPNETESYIMFENLQAEYQTQSIELAARIQDEFTENIKITNRGVRQAGFLVLRETTMPSVLIEVGFVSNPAERKFLVSDSGKEKVAESIYKAFVDYKKNIDIKSIFNVGVTEVTEKRNNNKQDKVSQPTDSLIASSGQPKVNPASSENKVQATLIRQVKTETLSGEKAPVANDSILQTKTREQIQDTIAIKNSSSKQPKVNVSEQQKQTVQNNPVLPTGTDPRLKEKQTGKTQVTIQAETTIALQDKGTSQTQTMKQPETTTSLQGKQTIKTQVTTQPTSTLPDKKITDPQTFNGEQSYYSVQIGAVGNAVEPVPANFKGEKNVFRIRVNPYYKFYCGKFATIPEALKERSHLLEKFPGAFLVVIENNIPRPLKKEELP
jgi:N-acetylmuramoyl-L-alanine amidase